MSFAVPRNVPSFSNPQRRHEDLLWSATKNRGGVSAGGLLGRVEQRFTDKYSLPMYKDKPYAYQPRRIKPLYRRKRVLGLVSLLVLALLFFGGGFGNSRQTSNRAKANASKAWGWLASGTESVKGDWFQRREEVVAAFKLSWDAYQRYAWGYDEYQPISKKGVQMAPKGLGWIIIDALDTAMIMNLTSRVEHARKWIAKDLTYDQSQDVNTFETTIRMLGGLLSAHHLFTKYPDLAPLTDDDVGAAGEDLYLEKAKDLADRLISAFDSESGIPYSSVILNKYQGVPAHDAGGASSTAEATTVQLEFKYLSKLTGEKHYWDTVERVMQVVDDNGATGGLVPIYISPVTGKFYGNNIRLGSRGDSYYEYLIKQYLQTNKKESIYMDMWNDALQGIRDYLITYTEPSQFTIVGERPYGVEGRLVPKMDHLVCFLPGTIALSVTGGLSEAEARKLPTWSKKHDADMQLARELMQTCWGMYKYMATGLAAEITYFNIADPPLPESAPHKAPATFDDDNNGKVSVETGSGDVHGVAKHQEKKPAHTAKWREDFDVHEADRHNLQRPETVESLFYMWRVTGDTKYREWGWEMFVSFMNYTAVPENGGFSSLSNANVIPPVFRDNMESFWLAETLKFFYLLFSPRDFLPLTDIVFNTEAHPLPVFEMGPLFSTGWKRKPRDAKGSIIEHSTQTATKDDVKVNLQ